MDRSTKSPGFAGLALIPLLAAAAAAMPRPDRTLTEPLNEEGREAVPRQPSAAAQIAHAASIRSGMRGKEGDAREAARHAAIEAYRAVRQYFGDDARACAESAFRAGELLRAASEAPAAMAEFKIAWERGVGSPFRARAGIEIGHLHRRAKEPAEALLAYEGVFADPGTTPAQRDDAAYWTGRVHADAGRIAEARRAWQRIADGAEDPLDRIRAWDAVALSYVAAGDLEAAAGAIERCREALSETAAEETRLGERVRNALAAMRAVDDLQRAVQERERPAKVGDDKKKEGSSSSGSRD